MNQITVKNVNKANSSFKWTVLSETSAKIAAPLFNMILARMLTPEVFGIVASIGIVSTLAQTIADGGFGRYLLQHQFSSENELKRTVKTSIFVSVIFSIIFCLLIFIFSNQLATLLNANGYGLMMIVGSLSIPFSGINSIFNSLCYKDFKYKKLAFIRVVSLLFQGVIEVVLAILGFGAWSIIIGSVCVFFIRFVLLLITDYKRAGFWFYKNEFNQIWSYSCLYLIDSFLTWLNTSIDVFIIGFFMGQTEAGIYKNGYTTTTGIITLVTACYSSVFISLLSTMQNDLPDFRATIYKYQKNMAFLFIPLGIGMLIFKDFLSFVFFGSGWGGTAIVIGVFSLFSCFKAATADFVMAAFTANGNPKYNIFSNLAYSIAIVITCVYFGNKGFTNFVIARSTCVIVPALFSLYFGYKIIHISFWKILRNLLKPFFLSFSMAIIGFALSTFSSTSLNFAIAIVFCIIFYFMLFYFLYPMEFAELSNIFIGKTRKNQLSRLQN